MKKDIFNKMAKKGFYLLLYPLTPLLLVGCNDFLTLYPTNKTVGKDFWKTKEDVQTMVTGAYGSMTSPGCQERAIIWGAFRSDELVQYEGNANTDLANISALNFFPTNGYNSWEAFYQVINRCNIVLNHIDDVLEIDPVFTRGDYDETRAQMLALRSLCYFYLVRTFRDVPYISESYEDDLREMSVPQTAPDSVLQACIDDLQEAERFIMKSGAYGSGDWRNKGYFTTDAVRALLADIYLWRASINHDEADYQKCVEYADKVINAKHDYYMSNRTGGAITAEADNYHLQNYNSMFPDLFVEKNSHESILEWQYNGESNTALNSLYNGNVLLASKIFNQCDASANTPQGSLIFASENDTRLLQFVFDVYNNKDNSDKPNDIRKLVASSSYLTSEKKGDVKKNFNGNAKGHNWIVYRLADVMLMKAEALVQLATEEEGDKSLQQAFSLVQAVNKRSMRSNATDTLRQNSFKTKEQMECLVLVERERELCFEGKRWYDLMRYCYRKMEGVDLTTKLADKTEWPALYSGMLDKIKNKFSSGAVAIDYKMKSEPYLYWPVLEREMKANKMLKQNPVFIQDESTVRN